MNTRLGTISATAPVRRNAYTLVELLVTIAIIGILIAPAAACCAGSARGGETHAMCEQPQADFVGDAQLSRHAP